MLLKRSKGFVLINYLFYLLFVSIITLLCLKMNNHYLKILVKMDMNLFDFKLETIEFFKRSEEACRDICLIEEVLS